MGLLLVLVLVLLLLFIFIDISSTGYVSPIGQRNTDVNVLLVGATSYYGYHLSVGLAGRGIPFVAIEISSNKTLSALYSRRRAWHLLLAHDVKVASWEGCGDVKLLRHGFSHVIYLGDSEECLNSLFMEAAECASKPLVLYENRILTDISLLKKMSAQHGVDSLGLIFEPGSFSLGTWSRTDLEPYRSLRLLPSDSPKVAESDSVSYT